MTSQAPLILHRSPSGASWYDLGYYKADTLGRRIEENMPRWGGHKLEFNSATKPSRTTLAEAWEKAKRVAASLLAIGMKPGDRFAVQAPCWEECLVSYLAGLHGGFVIVPVVGILGAKEVGYMMRNCGARVLICARAFRNRDYTAAIQELVADGSAERVVVIGGCEGLPDACESWETFVARASAPAPAGPNRPDDVALILYTSGTTADPKGARHTHNTLGFELVADTYAPEPVSIGLGIMPPGHTAGTLMFLRPFFGGEDCYFLDEWNAEAACRLIDKHKITRSSATPFHLVQMTEVAERLKLDLSSMKTFIVGATNVTPEVVENGLKYGIVSCRCYGSTEHPTVSASKTFDPPHKRAFTDGKLLMGVTLRFVDDDGKDLPPGVEGEILSNGPDLCAGYTDAARNAETFIDDVWYRTGDAGRIDEDGFLVITDRKKDIVIRGGENISSREVEEALCRHPAVYEAAVVPYPDPLMQERVCAFITLTPQATFSLDDARAHFSALGLAKQKTPERLEVIAEMPRTPIGKIKKSDLKTLIRRKVAEETAA